MFLAAVLDTEDVEARTFSDIAVEIVDQRGFGVAVIGVEEAVTRSSQW